VYSSETESRFHAIASMRLAKIPNVHLSLSDSRAFLRELSDGALRGKTVLFYLDAHWYTETPLLDEVQWIASHWGRFANDR
jgi:hypothetical protein